jgi:hypothetical protein
MSEFEKLNNRTHAEMAAELRARLDAEPQIAEFVAATRRLEAELTNVIEREPTQDLRVVVGALGPLLARAVAHLTDRDGLVICAFDATTRTAADTGAEAA